jgi:hypothetical protein
MPPRELFSEGAREALVATGLDADARARFEALVIWELRTGLIAPGNIRLICIGADSLEFTFNDQKQVVHVRLAPQAAAEPTEEDGSGPVII